MARLPMSGLCVRGAWIDMYMSICMFADVYITFNSFALFLFMLGIPSHPLPFSIFPPCKRSRSDFVCAVVLSMCPVKWRQQQHIQRRQFSCAVNYNNLLALYHEVKISCDFCCRWQTKQRTRKRTIKHTLYSAMGSTRCVCARRTCIYMYEYIILYTFIYVYFSWKKSSIQLTTWFMVSLLRSALKPYNIRSDACNFFFSCYFHSLLCDATCPAESTTPAINSGVVLESEIFHPLNVWQRFLTFGFLHLL